MAFVDPGVGPSLIDADEEPRSLNLAEAAEEADRDIRFGGGRRTRKRPSLFKLDAEQREEIADRVVTLFRRDLDDRQEDIENRLQRYAKLRMWTEGAKDWPWEDASDIPLPDILEKSLRIQDTLGNAVLSQRPTMNAKTVGEPDEETEEAIDQLLDFQFFVEQQGESKVGDAADSFTNDGVVTAFVPWVREMREVSDNRTFPPIPDDQLPGAYFEGLLGASFPDFQLVDDGRSKGWDWKITGPDGKPQDLKFYTRDDGSVEWVRRYEATVYDGPSVQIMDYEDVVYPARAGNLRIPGPSNPHGAPHVVLRSYPTIDEIRRLKLSGVYDLLTDDELELMESTPAKVDDQPEKDQKDALEGKQNNPLPARARAQKKLTRLLMFDTYEIEEGKPAQDVMWWVILETKTLVKAAFLTDLYPMNPPRRPLAESPFIRVKNRREGISMPELLEGLHDAGKELLDQGIDSGTASIVPFFFYRPHGTMNPEVIKYRPGDGYPLGDPQRDVNFPQIGNAQAQGFILNLWALVGQMEERLSMIGDLELGRVPAGRSAALRTTGNMALLQAQGEARPERILRNFFLFWKEVWELMHALNQIFLPKNKRVRLLGFQPPEKDPFFKVDSRDDIAGDFVFEFKANVLNAGKLALQQAMERMIATYVSPLFIQAGVIDAEGIYRLGRDFGDSLGGDPDKYLKQPTPEAGEPRIMAAMAIATIVAGRAPDGVPAEPGGAIEHLETLVEFEQSDDFRALAEERAKLELYRAWRGRIEQRALQEQQQQALLAAAQQFQQATGGGAPGRPAEQVGAPSGAPRVSGGNELVDETLPTAGGGANAG